MKNNELMLKIENVSKIYKLGEIGGTTLRETLQRTKAKIFKKEDPTKKIGAKNYNKGEKFKALDNISFEVKKGDRIGIIGHNGAGKSTLLKLISRVTGPTEGKINLNGRVASMLEVGTGFHPELTGRENIYMNGAILGMTKKEIDAKMEDIIDFSEVRQFIDTPVKRYSSGMYVKLAFSVAAHLDSEILIMDEVLAVGDMAFQNKCLSKMKDVSEQEEKTILYVSHNMNTIRQLCNKVIVLKNGKIIFNGDVEKGIYEYLGVKSNKVNFEYEKSHHFAWKSNDLSINSLSILGKTNPIFTVGETVKGLVKLVALKEFGNLKIRFEISNSFNIKVGTAFSNEIFVKKGEQSILFEFPTSLFVPGEYLFDIIIYSSNSYGHEVVVDGVYPGMIITFENTLTNCLDLIWRSNYWGFIHLPDIKVLNK